MIPTHILEGVYDFLRENHSSSLENIYKSFQRRCSDSYNLFGPCYLLVQALSDNVNKHTQIIGQVLSKPQRLMAIFLVAETTKSDDTFTLALIDVAEKALDRYERKMVVDILHRQLNYGGKTLKTLLEESDKLTDQVEDVEDLKKMMGDTLHRIPATALNQMRNVVPDSIHIDKKNEAPTNMPFYEKMSTLDREFVGFEPDFLRPIPNQLPINPEEDVRIFEYSQLKWLEAGVFCDLQWDYNISVTSNALSMVREILQKAQQMQISTEEYNLLEENLEQEHIIKGCGFTPAHIPDMIEKNHVIVSLLIKKFNQQPNIEEYFEKLTQIEITLSVLEVVHKLYNSMYLPQEFLQYFITNCIHQCQQQKEKSNLTRMVRLVCVFIKAMIKQKNFNPKDMFMELQAFCIENSKISEASSLFKTLKGMIEAPHNP